MSKVKQDDLQLTRLQQLEGNIMEQGKEIAMPLAIDLTSALAGWWIGKQMKRNSLITGLAVCVAGRFHGLHMAMGREKKRVGYVAPENKHALSGIVDTYTDVENRVYHGDSPAIAFGVGMMLGGATNNQGLHGTEKTNETFTERAKNAWNEIAGDLKYRLYISKEAGTVEPAKVLEAAIPISGTDDLQIFLPGANLEQFDMSGLDSLEQRVHEYASEFENGESETQYPAKSEAVSMSGTDEDENSVGEVISTHIM